MIKVEVRTKNGFWGCYNSMGKAKKTASFLRKQGLNPKIIKVR